MAGASSRAPKGCGFDPQSGYVWEETDQCLSLSLSLFLPLSQTNKCLHLKKKKKNFQRFPCVSGGGPLTGSGLRSPCVCCGKRFFTFIRLLSFLPKFLRVDQDKDKDCSLDCGSSSQRPLCASDGRTFLSRCEFQRAKCKDPQLEIAYRGNCRGESVRRHPAARSGV